jgi:hypothetical protein
MLAGGSAPRRATLQVAEAEERKILMRMSETLG